MRPARSRRVAFLTALLQLLSRKLGDLAQAVFGWSVTALFGRQASSKGTALSVALALSVLWPLLVVGVFAPAAAAWLLAFIPLHRWMSDAALRVLWIALALAVPLIVGALTRWIAPSKAVRGSVLRTVLGGYPLTFAYAVSFVITLVTVPALKLSTLARRWTEEHAYVQPREGSYDAALHAVAAAFVGAELTPVIEPVPRAMSLAAGLLKRIARSFVAPLIPEEPHRVRAEGVEAWLYPSDLVLRGTTRNVARVRAALMNTSIERHAWLVESPAAQDVQRQVQRLWDVVVHHERERRALGSMASTRVREMLDALRTADVPFDEWAMLERMIRRLERRIGERGDARTTDPETVSLETVMESIPMNTQPPEEASVADLVRDAIGDARELIRVEVELARQELKKEAAAAQRAAIGFGVALAAGIIALALFAVALVFALGGTAAAAAGVGAAFVLVAAVAGGLAYGALPKSPFEQTRARVQADVQQIKESLA